MTRTIFYTLVLFAPAAIFGQATASISGSVQDQAGSSMAGVQLRLENTDSMVSRRGATDSAGRYVFAQLPPGRYQITAMKAGFSKNVRTGIDLATGQEEAITQTLAVGELNQQVVVPESATPVPVAGEQSTGITPGASIRDLPLNGRSYDHLMTLTPGVVDYTEEKNNTTPGISNSAVANMFAVDGRRPQENLFLLDGIEYTGSAEINMTPGGASGELLGVDAIREFNILTDSYGAQYGKRPGAQVLVTDRSGTNDLHGSLYEFLRNSAFDARNFFDRASVPEFQRNQFGATLSGPLQKNKTFLFGNDEGLRQDLDLSDVTLVPDNAARARATSPRVRQLLQLWPVQNGPELGGGIGEAFSTPKQTIGEDFGTIRLDHSHSDSDSLNTSYTVDDSRALTPTANPLALDAETLRDQVATLHETHVFSSTAVNTASIGYSRASYFYTGESGVSGIPGFIGNDQIGAIVIGGSATPNTASSITMAGSNNGSHLFATRNLYTAQDAVSFTRGIHQLSAGVWFQEVQSNDELALGQYGQATFSSLSAFLSGVVTTFTSVPSPTPLSWRSLEAAGWVQDEIRVSPGLTISLGFRNEGTTGWNEAHGRASSFIDGNNGALETQPQIGTSAFTVNRAKFLPQPRVGVAWSPDSAHKWVLRSAVGMYNDLQDSLSYRLDQNAPYNTSLTLSNVALSTLPLTPGNIPLTSKIAPAGVQPDLYTPTVLEWNFSAARQLTKNSTLTAAYAGSHGYHETASVDLNQPATDVPIRAGTPLANPALASSWTWVSWADSSYNALNLDWKQSLSHGLAFTAAYTWSKSLDDADTLNGSAAANAPGLAEDAHNLRLDWGPSTFDVRQVVSSSITYELPFACGNRWIGGWAVNAIVSYHTGLPFTPELSFNPSNNGNTTNPVRPSLNPNFSGPIIIGSPTEYYNPKAFIVPANGTYGNLGRNALTGPGVADLDTSLFKSFALREHSRLELRGEAFNILNHANFNTPNVVVFTSATAPPSGSAGVVTSTATTSRQIQIAAKLIW